MAVLSDSLKLHNALQKTGGEDFNINLTDDLSFWIRMIAGRNDNSWVFRPRIAFLPPEADATSDWVTSNGKYMPGCALLVSGNGADVQKALYAHYTDGIRWGDDDVVCSISHTDPTVHKFSDGTCICRATDTLKMGTVYSFAEPFVEPPVVVIGSSGVYSNGQMAVFKAADVTETGFTVRFARIVGTAIEQGVEGGSFKASYIAIGRWR